MRNRIEVFGEIRIDYVGVTPAYKPVHFLDSVGRTATRSITIGTILEIRFEDWLQNQLRSCFHHTITDCGYTKRAFTGSSWLRYHHPPHRRRPVRLRDQFLAQTSQPFAPARHLNVRECLSVHPRHAGVCTS